MAGQQDFWVEGGQNLQSQIFECWAFRVASEQFLPNERLWPPALPAKPTSFAPTCTCHSLIPSSHPKFTAC